jgi:hypothetical protein
MTQVVRLEAFVLYPPEKFTPPGQERMLTSTLLFSPLSVPHAWIRITCHYE